MAGKAASNVVGIATMLGATAVARKAVDTTWRIGAHKHPPSDPADPDVRLREAVVFAVLSGAAGGLARMLATRRVNTRVQRREAARSLRP